MKRQQLSALAVAALTAVALACSNSPGTPLSPSESDGGLAGVAADGRTLAAPTGRTLAASDGSTLKVTAPVPVSPIDGVVIEDLDPELVIENANPLYVSSLNLSYVFEVIDEDGVLLHRTDPPIAQGEGGRTSYQIPSELDENESHTWRVHAVMAGRQGPMSSVATFTTFLRPVPEVSRLGVSCASPGATPLDVVVCRFAQYSSLDEHELPDFLKQVAYDLNQLNLSDKGGFGVLVKTIGNNCGGYSCDIICEGQGGAQNQYDVLLDESFPQWSEVGDGLVARECEIIR
jgi:hypothetical protein